MWRLTVTYGEYDGPKTLVHESKNEHDWTYMNDGYWSFIGYADDGNVEWSALVMDLKSAVDAKMLEPLCFDTSHDHSTSSCLGSTTAQGEGVEGVDPVSGWVQD